MSRDTARSSTKSVAADNREYKCSYCGKRFSRPRQLAAHSRLHTGSLQQQTMFETYHCEYCDRSCVDFDHVFAHEKVYRDVRPHKCPLCNKGYKLKRSLRAHLTTKHPTECHLHDEGEDDNGDGQHICVDRFDRQLSVATSTAGSSSTELEMWHTPLKCTQCEIEFKNVGHYSRHMKLHAKERNFECTACRRYFAKREEMTAHMLTHVDSDQLHCGVCNRSFRSQQQLEHHIVGHRKTHLHECPVCRKRYKTLGFLRRHKLRLGHLAVNERRILDEPAATAERDHSISPELASFTPVPTPESSPAGSLAGSKEDIQQFVKEMLEQEIEKLPDKIEEQLETRLTKKDDEKDIVIKKMEKRDESVQELSDKCIDSEASSKHAMAAQKESPIAEEQNIKMDIVKIEPEIILINEPIHETKQFQVSHSRKENEKLTTGDDSGFNELDLDIDQDEAQTDEAILVEEEHDYAKSPAVEAGEYLEKHEKEQMEKVHVNQIGEKENEENDNIVDKEKELEMFDENNAREGGAICSGSITIQSVDDIETKTSVNIMMQVQYMEDRGVGNEREVVLNVTNTVDQV